MNNLTIIFNAYYSKKSLLKILINLKRYKVIIVENSLDKKIKGINLETFLKQNYAEKLSKLSFIKIDTEGYDKEIIKSIKNLLTEFRPVVVSECFFKSSPTDRFEHFEVLNSIGYSLFYFNDFELNTEIIPILKKEDMLKWKHYNFYAVKK